MSSTATAPDRHRPPGWLAAVAVGLVAPRTWLAAGDLAVSALSGFGLGLAVGIMVVTSVGLIPFALVGVPLLLLVVHLCRGLAWWERRRIHTLAGVDIGAPALPARQPGQSFLAWQRAWLLSGSAWLLVAYQLARMVVGMVLGTIALAVWSLAVALIVLPAYVSPAVSGAQNRWFGSGTPTVTELVLLVAGGVVLLLTAPWVTRGFAEIDTALASAMIGERRVDRLSTEVSRLARTRSRVVDATDAERRRIERDLHDGIQPRLVSLAMTIGMAQSKFDHDPEEARRLMSQAHDNAKTALSDLRGLARGIHPSVLDDRGLDAALSALVAGSATPVRVDVDLPARPTRTVEAVAYFFVAEAVTNAAKHARAGRISVDVRNDGSTVRILVTDDGRGGAVATPGGGLAGLADRLAAVDGTLAVASPAGGPTRLEAVIPCGS